MSKQLYLAAALSVFTIAAFTLSATASRVGHFETTTSAETLVATPVFAAIEAYLPIP